MFDMKKREWNEALNDLDVELVEKYVAKKDELRRKKSRKNIFIRIVAIAACIAVISGAIVIVPMFKKNKGDTFTTEDPIQSDLFTPVDTPSISELMLPAQRLTPSDKPNRYGELIDTDSSIIGYKSFVATARYIETLPDTYTFFGDQMQNEYRIIRMKGIKLHNGNNLPDEFCFLIPVSHMTDFSLFDQFLVSMVQYGYEFSILYNKTQNKVERLDAILFASKPAISYYPNYIGNELKAFDSEGNFDDRLWSANEAWIESTKRARRPKNIDTALDAYSFDDIMTVNTLEGITDEAAEVIDMIRSLDHGIYVPNPSTDYYPKASLIAVRYINGFATNEKVAVINKFIHKINAEGDEDIENCDGYSDTYKFTKAQFTEDDMNALPDLTTAYSEVVKALEEGKIKPLHCSPQGEISEQTAGAFGWYAKTENGVIGIIKVEWHFRGRSDYLDDSYFIIESDSSICKQIDRDELLEMLGEYEKTYIYTGEYDEFGKERNLLLC